jgi:hypothetical protein
MNAHALDTPQIPPTVAIAPIRAVIAKLVDLDPLTPHTIVNVCAGNGVWGRIIAQALPSARVIGFDHTRYAPHYYYDYEHMYVCNILNAAREHAHAHPYANTHMATSGPATACDLVVGTPPRTDLSAYAAACMHLWPRATCVLVSDSQPDMGANAMWYIDSSESAAHIWTDDARYHTQTIPRSPYDPREAFERRLRALDRRHGPVNPASTPLRAESYTDLVNDADTYH